MDLYKNNPYYVPSLSMMKSTFGMLMKILRFNILKQTVSGYKNDKIVGRIAVIINHKEEKN
jgi:hypothetical protein